MPLFLFVKYIELIFKKDNILVKIHKNTSLYKNNISTKINDNKNKKVSVEYIYANSLDDE